MLKIQDIRELIKAIDQSSIEEFKYEQEGTKVTLRKERKVTEQVQAQPLVVQQPAVAQAAEQAAPVQQQAHPEQQVKQEAPVVAKDENLHKITAPMVGTFYAAPSPDSPNYVKVGDKVKNDSVVCIVEAMKLMNELEAEISGEIVEILVENGQLVEYGQELFLVKPE